MKKQVVFLWLLLAFAMPSWGEMKLAVLEPEGKGLSKDELWMLSLVQSSIAGDINKYSGGAITIIDRQNLEAIIAEQKRSLSDITSDEDAVRIGNLANASHILVGKITKTPNAFMLELSITDVETSERKASYSPRAVTPEALENLSALKEASADLLKQLGVNLTAAQLAELKGPVTTIQIQAQTALAHGVVAQRQGTSVAALSYYYQAAAFDPTLVEAVKRSSVMSANISGTNLGENIRNDIIWRKNWVENLKETEETFSKIISATAPPYTLFYSTGIETKNINYQKESADLSIPINLTANAEWFNAMQRALQAADAVLKGLNATGRKSDWGLSGWPGQGVSNTNPFSSWSSSWHRDISVEFELVNQQGRVIGRQTARLSPSFRISNRHSDKFTVDFTEITDNTLTFSSVKAEDISDNLTIRPASVNGKSPELAGFPITAISAKKRKDDLTWRIEKGVLMGFADKREQHGKSIVIPDEVFGQTITAIGQRAFANSGLVSVTIPNGITSIGAEAFANSGLASVTIPNSVTSIGEKAFANNRLISVAISNSLASIEVGAFENNRLSSIIIPNSVRNIGESAFANNELTSVTIPNSVKSIGAKAFEKNKLTSVVISNSVRSLGKDAFAYSYTTKCCDSQGKQVLDKEFNDIKQITIGENVRIAGAFGDDTSPIEQIYNKNNGYAGTYTYRDAFRGWEKVAETEEEKKELQTAWHWSPSFSLGAPVMLNSIDSNYSSLGFQVSGSVEIFKPSFSFFRFGLNLDVGAVGISKMEKAIEEKYPEADSIIGSNILIKGGALVRLYPSDFIYLSGGANFGYYSGCDGISKASGEKIAEIKGVSTVIFPVGVGLVFGSDGGFLIEALYNIAKLKKGYGGYLSFTIGGKVGQIRFD